MHGAESAWHIQEGTRLMKVDLGLTLRTQTYKDAIEVQQIHGVVDVHEGLQLEVAQDQVVAARRRGARETGRLPGFPVRQMIRGFRTAAIAKKGDGYAVGFGRLQAVRERCALKRFNHPGL
jgi:hypothetical protein